MTKRRKIVVSIVFIIVSLAGILIFYYQGNLISRSKIKPEILAPNEIVMGQEVDYVFKCKNDSNFTLQDPKVIFLYPDGSIFEEPQDLRQEAVMDDIYPGDEKAITFKTRLLGREGEAKQAKAIFSYKVKGLKKRFESEASHTALITLSPITFKFDFPSKVGVGKDVSILINYFSRVDFPLSNLRVEVDYPPDFQLISSKPKGMADNEWDLGLLNNAEGGQIEIKGKLNGEIFSQKIFKARLVSWQNDKKIILKEETKGLELVNPSLYLTWQVNGSPQYVANIGDYLHYEISFKNIGDNTLENLFLQVKIGGEALDINTVQSGSGKFQKEGNGGSVIWDQNMVPRLRLLEPSGEGKVEFWVRVKGELPSASRNNIITANIDLNQARDTITTKVNTFLFIGQRGIFHQSLFENKGPLPPLVGSTTTYTIFWQAKSLYNDAKNVKVKAYLPSNVRLTSELMPKEAKLSFDPGSRELVWDIGDLFAGDIGQEIQFQVALTPTDDQKGKVAQIIPGAKIFADDTWSGSQLVIEDSIIDTSLPDDPTITDEQGIVQ